MSQLVNITLKLRDADQSYFFQIHLEKMFPNGGLVSYENIKDTSELYESDPVFRKLAKAAKDAKKAKYDYHDRKG